jgi:hypothetical protein
MDTTQIILFSVVLAAVGFRLYQKFYKKDLIKGGTDITNSDKKGFYSKSAGDDYEPYSKK